MVRPLSAWEPGVTSPIIDLQSCWALDVMSILIALDAPYPVRFVKFIGLLHLTARPLTGPLASVPASITFGCRGTIEWKAGAVIFFNFSS